MRESGLIPLHLQATTEEDARSWRDMLGLRQADRVRGQMTEDPGQVTLNSGPPPIEAL